MFDEGVAGMLTISLIAVVVISVVVLWHQYASGALLGSDEQPTPLDLSEDAAPPTARAA